MQRSTLLCSVTSTAHRWASFSRVTAGAKMTLAPVYASDLNGDWSAGVGIAPRAVTPRREAKHALPDRAVRGDSKEAHVRQGRRLAIDAHRCPCRKQRSARGPYNTNSPRAAPPPRGPIFPRKRPQEAHHSL